MCCQEVSLKSVVQWQADSAESLIMQSLFHSIWGCGDATECFFVVLPWLAEDQGVDNEVLVTVLFKKLQPLHDGVASVGTYKD